MNYNYITITTITTITTSNNNDTINFYNNLVVIENKT